ncbi:twin-arginine translocase TatA/TatE family subunit [Corallococcus sp. H22C18031201]|uniref:twin-arginine translocase TatA/TatE family subunit n=1 Tax=Citreicoccus inhibens TaxID=2849499 RepID=UPI000E70FDD9|nr:twin-arginine translocase TatA/TatE family subunit [Citreicoccus inhibens]MBU8896873.1 twin-arginine translocase TatA/TatE family subunit [Citreicoccus inhibens]RJS20769.1 twin-arginine translocase TatA/TatE family subunit [Corallococcus sp. H22C18031201]
MGLKLPELILIFAALLLLFGGSRLPQLGASLGSAIRNFKRGFSGDDHADAPEEKKTGALASTSSVEKDVAAKSHSHQG